MEFVELRNIATSNVPLYHVDAPSNTWTFTGAMDFAFPTNTSIPPGGRLIVSETNPATFATAYGLTNTQGILGPYAGRLQNAGGTIELLQPDRPQGPSDPSPGFVPYCLAERVDYDDRNGWSEWADGHGPSLERLEGTAYGNDPTNWGYYVAAGSPGQSNNVSDRVDTDGDGMADMWERHHYTNSFDVSWVLPNADGPDGDNLGNLREYVLGYNPISETNSEFRLAAALQGSNMAIEFASRAAQGIGYGDSVRYYTLEQATNLSPPIAWSPIPNATNIPATGSTITNTIPATQTSTFIRCAVDLLP